MISNIIDSLHKEQGMAVVRKLDISESEGELEEMLRTQIPIVMEGENNYETVAVRK